MKILLELPDAFAEHFAMYKFKDSLMRICADISEVQKRRKIGHQNLPFISGNYERELYKACENWALSQTALSDIWEQGEPGAWLKMRDHCQKLREEAK